MNKNYTMKKILTLILIAFAITSFSQDIKLGDSFTQYEKDFQKKGFYKGTSWIAYTNKKPYQKNVYNLSVHSLVLLVKTNKIIGYIFYLNPNPSSSGIPKKFIDDVEKELGLKLVKVNDTYGISDGNIGLQISRQYDSEFGGDKIKIFTKILN